MAFLAKAHNGYDQADGALLYHVVTDVFVKKITFGDSTIPVTESGYYVVVQVSVYNSKEEKDNNMAPRYTFNSSLFNKPSQDNYVFKIPDITSPVNLIELAYQHMKTLDQYKSAEEV